MKLRKAIRRVQLSYYETIFIARQDISPAQTDSLAETFEEVLKGLGGQVTKKENWGLRTLAYKIKKNKKGHYVLMNIDAPATAIFELERQMRINDDILRYMTVKVDILDEQPSAMMRFKASDEKPRREHYNEHDDNRPYNTN